MAVVFTHVLVAMLIAALARPRPAYASAVQLVPSLSLSASGPRLAVVVVGLDPKARSQAGLLESAGEAATARAGRFTLVSSVDALSPAAAKARAGKLELARKRVQVGKQNLDDLDNVKATDAFTEALAALKETDSTSTFKEYLEVWVLKAASHATGGENAAAKKDIDAVLALNPKAEFSPTYFSPDLIKFAEAQRKQAGANHGELTLSTTPSGARVWVDGAYQGTSPLTVAGLAPVKHQVAAAAPGTQLTQVELGLGEEKVALEPAEQSGAWKRALGLITSDPEGPGRDAGAKELAKAMGVEQVLLIEARKSTAGEQVDLVVSRVDATDGHNWAFRVTTLSLGKPEAIAQFFDLVFLKDTPREGKSPVTHYKEGSANRALLSYGLMGLGVVGVGTGAVFGFMASDRANAWRATKQTDVLKSNALRSQGQSFAIVADVSILVGIAAAATGAVLLLTNKGNAASDPGPATAPAPKEDDSARRKEQDRKATEDRRKADDARRDEERQKERDRREAEERKKPEEPERKSPPPPAEEEPRKLTKKQQQEEERRRKEDEARAASEERKAAAAAKKGDAEERKKKEQDDADRKKKEDDDRRRIEEAQRKKAEDEKKKKKEEDHDDLRNY